MEMNDSLLSVPSKLNIPALPMCFPPKTKQLLSSRLNVGSSYSIRPNQRMGVCLNVGSSYSIRPNQRMGVLGGLLGPLSKFDKQPLQTNLEDDIPDILCGNTPTMGIIKVTSPNGKRVSTPHADSLDYLPGQLSGGRRLILRSLPAFPSLAPHD